MARILITGASGFIGGYLIAQALENGHEVTAAIRSSSDKTRLADPRLQLLEFPMGNVAAMSQLLQKSERFDWIIHNAGITKALSPEAYREGNTENTQRFTQALQNAGWLPDKFLFVSSLAALGAALPGNAKIHAHQKPSPLTPYGESKLAAEIMLAAMPVDFPWVVVQPTAVYGPWERDILTFIKLANKGLEMTIGRQSQRLSFVHAADVARAIFQVLETKHAVHRKYIISDGKNYTTEDLGAAVRAALGREKTLKIRLPLGLVSQVAGIAETIGRWQNKPSALSRDKLPELAASNWHCDATPLLKELNFQPEFDLFQGMKNTVDWYREHGWI
jgi:UDP-glucose 4-epimerase